MKIIHFTHEKIDDTVYFFGLGDNGKMYQYDYNSGKWILLKKEDKHSGALTAFA
jgi:hypothetical protein